MQQAGKANADRDLHIGLCHHPALFFSLLPSPRPVHMVIIIIPPKLPTLWSLSSRTPPTNQDGQATAWFARRLFCWFVRCHCHFPFEVPDSTSARPGLDIDLVLDPFASVPDLTWPTFGF